MKKYIVLFILAILLVITYFNREKLAVFYVDHFIKEEKKVDPPKNNHYARDIDFHYVQLTSNFSPNTKQEVLNIYYTILNSGVDEFTFYCQEEDTECMDYVKFLAKDQTILSHINNFVHPYNSFKHIVTKYDSLGKVIVTIEKYYSKEKIEEINQKIDELYPQLVNSNLSKESNIKAIHDYIINTSRYDKERSDSKIVKYDSDIAYGNLIQGIGLCGGYTDSMALFLERMGIKNYKISSENHVWNAVYLNQKWYHLDLTWDDPISEDGKDNLEYNFFLISSEELKTLEDAQHNFNQEIYQEIV